MSAGIYCIKCEVNNKIYVGQSKNIEQRWKHHKANLEKGEHINRELQKDYNEYGIDAFVFTILETIQNTNNLQKELFAREKYWGEKLDALGENGYNKTEFYKSYPNKLKEALDCCWKGSPIQHKITYLCYTFSHQAVCVYYQLYNRVGYSGWNNYPSEDDCLAVFTLEELAKLTNLTEQKVFKIIKDLDKKDVFILRQNTHDKNEYSVQFEEVGDFDGNKWKRVRKDAKDSGPKKRTLGKQKLNKS